MVRVVGPCFSLDASKTLKKILEYRRSLGQAIVSKFHKPGSRAPFVIGYHPYQKQLIMKDAVEHWHMLTSAQKQLWDDYVADP